MYKKLQEVISAAGIWDGEKVRSHAFLLSPNVYHITKEQCKELTILGSAIYECLSGLSHIAVIAFDQRCNYKGAWLMARRIFSTGVPQIYHRLQGMNITHIPKLLKVDLMVDWSGNFNSPCKSPSVSSRDGGAPSTSLASKARRA